MGIEVNKGENGSDVAYFLRQFHASLLLSFRVLPGFSQILNIVSASMDVTLHGT